MRYTPPTKDTPCAITLDVGEKLFCYQCRKEIIKDNCTHVWNVNRDHTFFCNFKCETKGQEIIQKPRNEFSCKVVKKENV